MEGKHRHFNREGKEETQEQQRGNLWAVVGINPRRGVVQRLQTKRVNAGHVLMMEVEKQNPQQHQDGAGEGIEEKFDGSVELARASPDADQKKHRQTQALRK